MNHSESSESPINKISLRFRINLVLFISLAIFSMYWFYNHLQLYVTETIFIGGTLSIWAVWKLIQSWLNWGLKEGNISLSQRILNRTSATEYLILGFIFLFLLYISTSSIYLIYEGAKPGESEFTVQITSEGNPFLDPMNISSSKRIEGRPFFFRFETDTLSFEITKPRGFIPVKKEFNHWGNLRIRIPYDFERKEFNILQIVPGVVLFLRTLPNTTDTVKVKYHLKIERNNKSFFTVNDLRKQTIFLGADSLDIISLLAQRDKSIFRSDLQNYLIKNNIIDPNRSDIIRILEERFRIISTPEFQKGDKIKLSVYRDTSVVLSKTFHFEKKQTFKTIFIE